VNKNNNFEELDNDLLDSYAQSLGNNIIEKMFTLYCQQSAIYLNDIENSIASNSEQLWMEHCHKMKGAAGSVALKNVYARLKSMEKTTANLDDKMSQLDELKVHNKQAVAEFECWLQQH